MNNNYIVPVIEVNDYHLELFSFWKLYLNTVNRSPQFYFPRRYHKKKLRRKYTSGTFGGIFETLIPRKDLHRISELTTDMKGDLVIFNTFVNYGEKNYDNFMTLIDHLSKNYTTAIVVFHGYEPNILKDTSTIQCLDKFRKTHPLFLHPNLCCHKFGLSYLTCLPIHEIIKNNNLLLGKEAINIGIIGTVYPLRNYQMVLEMIQLINRVIGDHPIKIYIIGATPSDKYLCYFENLKSYVIDHNLGHQVFFNLDQPSVNFKYNLQLLHFIAPVPNLLNYYYTTLNGSIPLALSFSIPLILPALLANQYGIVNQLTYTNHISETIDELLQMDDTKYNLLKQDMISCYNNYHTKNLDIFKSIQIYS